MNTFINSVYSKLEELVNKYIDGELDDKNKIISSITGASLRGDIKPHEEEHLLDLLNQDLYFDDDFDDENEEDEMYNTNSFLNMIDDEDEEDDLDDFLEDDENDEEEISNSGFLGLLNK